MSDTLTPAEAADRAGVSEETIRTAYQEGRLTAYQPTPKGRVSIPVEELDRWTTRSAARVDWSTPAPGAGAEDDVIVCDAYTNYIEVHGSRLADFNRAKNGDKPDAALRYG